MIPKSVSIVDSQCDLSTNILRVNYNSKGENKGKFGVCSKGITMHEDASSQFAEWLEVVKALGAEKVSLSTYEDVHPNLRKVIFHSIIFSILHL